MKKNGEGAQDLSSHQTGKGEELCMHAIGGSGSADPFIWI